MKKISTTLYLLLFVVSGFFTSCIEEDDFALDNITGISPVLALPLVNAELDLDHIVNLTGGDENGKIHVDYEGDMVRLSFFDTLSKAFTSSETKKASRKAAPGKIRIPFEQDLNVDLFALQIEGGITFDTALFEIKARGHYSQTPTENIAFEVKNLNISLVSKDGVENNITVHPASPLTLSENYTKVLHTNVGDLFSDIAARTIRCSFEIEVDTSLLGGNAVTPDSVDIAFYFGVAMNFKANITFSDTIPVNLDVFDDITNSDYNSELNNVNAKLYYYFENTFPVGLNVQAYFLSNNNVTIVDSLFNGSFGVNAGNNGIPSKTTGNPYIELSYNKLLKISKCPNIILKANLNTGGAMQTLNKKQRLKVLLGVEAGITNFTFDK